jgi:DNA mismatch repair protein MSH2
MLLTSSQGKANSAEQDRKVKRSSEMLNKVSDLVDTHSSSTKTIQCTKLPTLGKPLQNEQSAAEYTDSIMAQLLSSSPATAALNYRGNRLLAEIPQIKQTLGLLLREEGYPLSATQECYDVQMGQLTSHMQLDRIAAESIHLLPPPNNSLNAKFGSTPSDKSSIYGILNKCKTKMGSRLLETWLRQPLVNLRGIEARHNMVEALLQHSVERDQLRDAALGAVPDLDLLASKLSLYLSSIGPTTSNKVGNVGGLETLYRIYLFAQQQLPKVIDSFQDILRQQQQIDSSGAATQQIQHFHKELVLIHTSLLKVKELAREVIDLDLTPREFLVKSSFNDTLQDLKKELDDVETHLEQIHYKMDQEWSDVSGQGPNQVRLEVTDQDACAWQFRLPKTNDEKILRQELGQKVQVHRILKNGVYFSTKPLRDLGTRKQNILSEYHQIQKSIVDDAMRVAATYIPILEKASSVISEMDVLSSFAHVAAYHPEGYCRPHMTDSDDNGMGVKVRKYYNCCHLLINLYLICCSSILFS